MGWRWETHPPIMMQLTQERRPLVFISLPSRRHCSDYVAVGEALQCMVVSTTPVASWASWALKLLWQLIEGVPQYTLIELNNRLVFLAVTKMVILSEWHLLKYNLHRIYKSDTVGVFPSYLYLGRQHCSRFPKTETTFKSNFRRKDVQSAMESCL